MKSFVEAIALGLVVGLVLTAIAYAAATFFGPLRTVVRSGQGQSLVETDGVVVWATPVTTLAGGKLALLEFPKPIFVGPCIAASLVVCPIGWLLWKGRLRLRRARAGRCHCSYDLRATPDRCPECGHRGRRVDHIGR